MEKEKPVEIEVGNAFVVRKYEPEVRIWGVVTSVGENYSLATVVKTNRQYDFRAVEVTYVIDMKRDGDEIEVLSSLKEVLA